MISFKNGSVAFFIFIIFSFEIYVFYVNDYTNFYTFDQLKTFSIQKNKEKNLTKFPLILAATSFFKGKLFESSILREAIKNCPIKCNYTYDKR